MEPIPSSPTARTQGIHHLGLTVPDPQVAAAFFVEALGFHGVGGRPACSAVFVSDGTVTLTLWRAAPDARAFDRVHHVGLHHVALRVAAETFEATCAALAARPDVTLEFPPCALGAGRHCMLRVPGGLRLELAWTP